MNCLKCKRSVPEDSEFCPYCGSIVEHIQPSVCKSCGRVVPNDSEFCPYCGAAVTCNATVTCSSCGKALPEDAEFCPLCGYASVSDQTKAINPSTYKDQKPKTRKKAWIWAVPVAAIVLVVGILFWRHAANRQVSIGEARVMSLNDAADAVLYLEMYDENDDCIGSASGFLVNDQTTLVTNYHVVQDAYKIIAWTATNDISVEANLLLAYDEVDDLAILKCDEPLDITPLYLEDSDTVVQGNPIYAVGYPLGLANTLSDGVISSRYFDEYGVDVLQVTAAISEGNSGGPLLNENGQVVGVVCAYYVDGQNLNIGVTSNALKQLLDENSSSVNIRYWKNRPSAPWQIEEEDLSSQPDTIVDNNISSEEHVLTLAEKWSTVTLENLQGTWIGVDPSGDIEAIEIQANYGFNYYLNETGEIDYSKYMGEGIVSITDRSSSGKCPMISFSDKTTFYISYVTNDYLYNAGYDVYYYKQ